MLKKSLFLILLLGACKSSPSSKTETPVYLGVQLSENGGFTGGIPAHTFTADGRVLNAQGDSIGSLNADQLQVLKAQAQTLAEMKFYQGVPGRLQRTMQLYLPADTLNFSWSIEDSTSAAKTLNLSFSRLYPFLP